VKRQLGEEEGRSTERRKKKRQAIAPKASKPLTDKGRAAGVARLG
jgi:hypothetical protein